jgi:transcriptional regulator with XRE-family HTH domain
VSTEKFLLETGTKHPKTTKFLELAGKVGWKQADVARALKRSKGQISKIYNEKLPPSDTLLKLLEHEVNAVLAAQGRIEEANKGIVGAPSAISESEKLSFLKQHDPAGFRVAANAIEPLYQRAVDEVILHEKKKPKPASSAEVSQAAAEANASAEKLEGAGGEGTGQYGGAGAPPVRIEQPGSPSSRSSKARRIGHGGKGRT